MLNLDANGDDVKDLQVSATSTLEGAAAYDQTPPKTTIALDGIKGNNGWYKSDVTVTLNTEDESSGSGILKTEYSLDNGHTIQVYTIPFTLSQEGTNKLKFRSIDKAGNEEIAHEIEIKIDKTPPMVTLSSNPNILWPPNKKLVDVIIAGYALDNISGISSKNFTFDDEYKALSPVVGDFNQMTRLEAWRNGDDLDGRKYQIEVKTEDQAGNKSEANATVIVPHARRN